MRKKPYRRKCLGCKDLFDADYRNGRHQKFCSKPACRQASKKASQRRWRAKPENHSYDCGPHRVAQVQAWRKRHPGYSKAKPKSISDVKPADSQIVNSEQSSRNAEISQTPPLRDVCLEKKPAFVGLISMLIGSTLRDDIAAITQQLLEKGENILGIKTPKSTHET